MHIICLGFKNCKKSQSIKFYILEVLEGSSLNNCFFIDFLKNVTFMYLKKKKKECVKMAAWHMKNKGIGSLSVYGSHMTYAIII